MVKSPSTGNRRHADSSACTSRGLADADDISIRIVREAAGFERWTEVQPSMFEGTLDQELAKYDKFRRDIEENAARQSELLENVKESVLSAGGSSPALS